MIAEKILERLNKLIKNILKRNAKRVNELLTLFWLFKTVTNQIERK